MPAQGSRSWPFRVSMPPDSASLRSCWKGRESPLRDSQTHASCPHMVVGPGPVPSTAEGTSEGQVSGGPEGRVWRAGLQMQPCGFGPVPGLRSVSWEAASPTQGSPPTSCSRLSPFMPHLTCSASGTISQHRATLSGTSKGVPGTQPTRFRPGAPPPPSGHPAYPYTLKP